MLTNFSHTFLQRVYYILPFDAYCWVGSEANNHAVWGSNLSFVCNAQECNLQHRNATKVVCICDHKVEMESDAERRWRSTMVQMQWHCWAEDDSQMRQWQKADRHRHNLIRACIGQSLVFAASNGVAELISWLIYKYSRGWFLEAATVNAGRRRHITVTYAK